MNRAQVPLTDELVEAMLLRRGTRTSALEMRAQLAERIVATPQRRNGVRLTWPVTAPRTAVATAVVAVLLALLALVAGRHDDQAPRERALLAYERAGAVLVLDVGTGLEREVTRPAGDDSTLVAPPLWSTAGDLLVVQGQLARVVRTDGSEAARLRVEPPGLPVWSPDGGTVAVLDTEASAIRLMSLDGSRRVLPLPALEGLAPDGEAPAGWVDGSLAWAPDGGRIALVANTSCSAGCGGKPSGAMLGWEVHVIRLDTGEATRIAVVPEDSTTARAEPPVVAWSPDSGSMAVGTRSIRERTTGTCVLTPCRSGGTHVAVLDLAGAVRSTFDVDGPAWEPRVAWSPDGARVAIGGGPLLVVGLAAGDQVVVGRGADFVSPQAWSPDGRSIAYGVSDDLFGVADAGGGGPRLFNLGSTIGYVIGGFGPAWRPAVGR